MSSAVPISIVIPSYKGLKFMELLVPCLKPYYDKGYEIILVEDGSDDGTKDIFLAAFPGAKYIWQENSGPAMARLKGVQHATGEFVQLLDVDDTIESDKIEQQYSKAKDDGLDVVYSGWRYAFKKKNEKVYYHPWILEDQYEDVVAAIFNGWWFPPAAMIVSRHAFLDIKGGDMSLTTTSEDVDLYLRLYTRGFKFGYCPGGFANHFHYEDTMTRSSTRSEEWWRDVGQVVMKTLSYLKEHDKLNFDQKKAGLNELFMAMRNMAKTNMSQALVYWDFINRMDKTYVPENQSALFMKIFNFFGYKYAERIALLYERISGRKGYAKEQKQRIYDKKQVSLK